MFYYKIKRNVDLIYKMYTQEYCSNLSSNDLNFVVRPIQWTLHNRLTLKHYTSAYKDTTLWYNNQWNWTTVKSAILQTLRRSPSYWLFVKAANFKHAPTRLGSGLTWNPYTKCKDPTLYLYNDLNCYLPNELHWKFINT